ncbi:MAG: ABC transporter permease [Desulfotignum sp.]|nr:ABC transporter permease [Desulfotignum sp.]MCF8089377.1 ABC transporter permease [Desulfotignum sp.]
MDDFRLSWRNIWRNKRRSALTILAIVFATALLVFMLSFQLGSYDDMINASVTLDTGHIQIMPTGYHADRKIRNVIDSPDKLLDTVKKLPSVKGAAARAESFCLASSDNRTKGVLISGVHPAQEQTVSRLSSSMKTGEYLATDDDDAAVIGLLLAKRLKLGIGDELTLLGQGRDGSIAAGIVTIKGIFQSGVDEFDRNVIQVPYSYFNDMFYMNHTAHRIVVLLDSLNTIENSRTAIAEQIDTIDTARLEMFTWDTLMPGLKQTINLDLISGFIMYGILIIVVCFSILNTFLMSILERKKEYGVLIAIGTTPLRLIKFVLTESMLMTITGLIIGIGAGTAVTLFFSHHGIGLGEASDMLSQYGISDRLYPKLTLVSLFSGPLLILVFTFLTALIPALKIRTLRPVEAIHSI